MEEIEALVYTTKKDIPTLEQNYWSIRDRFNVFVDARSSEGGGTTTTKTKTTTTTTVEHIVILRGFYDDVFEALRFLSSLGVTGTRRANISFPVQPWKMSAIVGQKAENLRKLPPSVRMTVPLKGAVYETVTMTGERVEVEQAYRSVCIANLSRNARACGYVPPVAVPIKVRSVDDISASLGRKTGELTDILKLATAALSSVKKVTGVDIEAEMEEKEKKKKEMEMEMEVVAASKDAKGGEGEEGEGEGKESQSMDSTVPPPPAIGIQTTQTPAQETKGEKGAIEKLIEETKAKLKEKGIAADERKITEEDLKAIQVPDIFIPILINVLH